MVKSWRSGNNDTLKEAQVKSLNASFPGWSKHIGSSGRSKSQVAQTLTDHGEFTHYLYRFELRDSPYRACDSAKIQSVLHVLEDCDMFHRECVALKVWIDVRIARRNFPEILEDVTKREKF
ncbi:hypothetical protein EVAR_7905_1 [Eumeta japonica]|uniref:Uncharacterized protein n=1 Tax=Eumeta variegata TaxID=151549 RepID=A0A4C1TV55_EUMVA|nr:hypothetical protein EVAR_7905_1 [Eumeta japonica]